MTHSAYEMIYEVQSTLYVITYFSHTTGKNLKRNILFLFVFLSSSCQTSSSTSSSSLSTNDLSVRISEFVENPTAPIEFTSTTEDDDVDMQSIASSDTGDRMDDD